MAFAQVQNGVAVTGSAAGGATTVQLTLPGASTAGTLLVACLVSGQAGLPYKITAINATGPNTAPGWEWCCTSVNGSGSAGQQVEIWCYRQNPGGITSTTWVVASGQGGRGHIMEFSSGLAWQVMELFPGLNTSVTPGDVSFPVSMGNPVGSGELAVALFGDNFSPGTVNTWTTPTGWTQGRATTTSLSMHWASYWKTTAAAGAVSVTGVASTGTNELGWEAALVVFRETAAVAARVGASCSASSYNDQGSFGLPSTKTGSSAEFDTFIGRTMAQSAQVSYQHEGAHLTSGPTSDLNELSAMGAQICWALKPNRTGVSGFTTVAAEQAAVDLDVTLVKQSGINGFICTLYNEFNLGGANGPFGNDTNKPTGDPYGTGNTEATAKTNWLTYWANYAPTLTAHGLAVMTKPSYASPASCATWHPPAGTVSGVMADFYCSDSTGKTAYLDNGTPSLQDVCDGARNPDNSVPSPTNTPIPLGIGEIGRSGSGALSPSWATVVSWSHTGGSTGHVRDFFKARLTANKQNAPILWFENNINGGNWIHTPGVGGEDQTGIQAELAAWVDNLAPQAAGTTVVVTTTTLPNAALGVFYSQALLVTGGSAPYTWAQLTGTLPTGLSLSSAGVISGTPTVAGTYTFTVKATDSGSNIGNSGTLQILVPAMAVTTTTLPAASIGAAYTTTLTETGGTGPFTWAVPADGLPAGIALSTAGVLSGNTPGPSGLYPFTAVVTDSLAATAQAALILTVSAGGTGGGAPAPPLYGYPQVIIEAGFYTPSPVAQPGTFILDDPVNGLLDTGMLGDGIAWTDITTYARAATVTRPSTRVQGPLRTYQAGTGSITLDNSDGRFDSQNLSGPYVTGGVSNIRPMVPLRARAVFGSVLYNVFSGFADTWQEDPVTYDAGWSQVTVSGSDGFKVLAGITLPVVPKIGNNEPSGSRVNRVLNDAGWFTDHRRTDPGNTVLQGTTYGDTVLSLLQLAADTEIGELYIDGSGTLVFREREAILEDTRSTTAQAVFGDLPGTSHAAGTELTCAAIGRALDDTTLCNDAQITRVGGTLQEAENTGSQATYLFPRSYARTDVILQSDTEALAYAQWIVYLSATAEDRFDTLTIDPVADPANLFPQVLSREIGDRILVYRRPQNSGTTISKPCFIRGITHTIDVAAGTWQTVWDLQDATRYAGFLILDDATLGKLSAGNRLAY
jgi:Putative Ig domain